jgi:hypothetical protein
MNADLNKWLDYLEHGLPVTRDAAAAIIRSFVDIVEFKFGITQSYRLK